MIDTQLVAFYSPWHGPFASDGIVLAFDDFDDIDPYDAIWDQMEGCSSLLDLLDCYLELPQQTYENELPHVLFPVTSTAAAAGGKGRSDAFQDKLAHVQDIVKSFRGLLVFGCWFFLLLTNNVSLF